LKARIVELERENAAPKAEPQKKTLGILEPKAWEILKYLFENAEEALTVRQITGRFNFGQGLKMAASEGRVRRRRLVS